MRVLAINDISCVGKCSLTVSLPIISACGVTCDVLPTAVLSTHTGGFEGYTFLDFTDEIPKILAHWKSLGLKFDYICSGYLGSIEQIEMVRAVKNEFLADGGKFIVDPVMGDGGKLYARFDAEFVKKMFSLCAEADVVVPNLTEACFLTGTPYDENQANVDVEKILHILAQTHTCPIVTGVVTGDIITSHYLENGKISRFSLPLIGGYYHGSGDVFTSALVGALARGTGLDKAVELASRFTTQAIECTAKHVGHEARYGVFFEEAIFDFLKALNE